MAMIAPPPPRPSGQGKGSSTTNNISPKTPRPLAPQRRSTLKRSIDESAALLPPSSPSKRSRVAFDSDIEIVSADEEDDLNPAIVKEQVRRAIERHRNGNHESYENLRSIFTTPADQKHAPSTRLVRVHLQALLANVATLSKDCSSLVNAVLFSEWIGRDDAFYTCFVKFITNLAAAQRGFQNKIMEMLVELLGPQKTRRLPDCKIVRAPRIHRRALQAIQYISANVPSAPGSLADRISAKMEFEFDSSEERMPFIRNFMQLIYYVPELTSEILVCVLRQLIKLDVNIQENLDDVEDEVEEELLQHMSDSQTLLASSSQNGLQSGMPSPPSEQDDDLDSITSSIEEEEKAAALAAETPEETSRRQLKDNIKQVDTIMDILFTYYTSLTTSADLTVRHNTIEQLVSHFHAHILPTYRSRHPQFLIFHFAQSDPIVVDRFVTSCVSILIDKRQPTHIRHAAAAYFSGFVGRGAHVTNLVVHDCIDLLVDHLNELRAKYEIGCLGPDLKRYGDFYAAFQAILYIFCFRWRDIGTPEDDDEDEDDDDFLTSTNYHTTNTTATSTGPRLHFELSFRDALQLAIYSPLNPLRVCTPVIVEQFAKLTHALQMMYIFPKIEENKHVRTATSGGFKYAGSSDMSVSDAGRDVSWVGDNGMLEGYFPYDPYSLPVSRRWIEGDYVQWKGIPGQELEDAEDSEDEDEDDDAADQEEGADDQI